MIKAFDETATIRVAIKAYASFIMKVTKEEFLIKYKGKSFMTLQEYEKIQDIDKSSNTIH